MSPSIPNGKICYIQIPALDVERSAAFYEAVFGWHIRGRSDGHLAFDDATPNGLPEHRSPIVPPRRIQACSCT